MPPTSEKLRGHIGLSPFVCLSVCNAFWQHGNSRTAYARILKFHTGMWLVHQFGIMPFFQLCHLKVYSLVGDIKNDLVKYLLQHIRNGLIIDLINS